MSFLDWWRRVIPFGRRSEIDGAAYLRSLGFRVIASGYRTRSVEIDLVAWDGDVLADVECKALDAGAPPDDAMVPQNQKRAIRAAQTYRSQYRLQNATYRFDILAVTARVGREPEFRILRDAFGIQRY